MEFLTSDTFVMVITVVGAAAGLFWALRADLGKRIDKVEEGLGKRIDKVEHGLGQRIDKVEEDLGGRIDKVKESLIRRIDKVEEDLGRRIDKVKEGLIRRIDKVEQGLGQRIDKGDQGLGQRIEKGDQDLGQRIDKVEQGLGQRIDRQGDRAHADQKNLAAEISELKTAVGVLNAKLDERSSPQRLVVEEPPGNYVAKTPESDPEAPEDDPQHPTVSTGEDAAVSAAADEGDDAQ